MYTRSYNEQTEPLCVPDGYSGTALPSGVHNEYTEEAVTDTAAVQSPEENDAVNTGIFGSLFSSPIFKGTLGNLFGGTLGFNGIGTEEILIIATAAFLFFSGDGDKECALLLLLLLFIN